MDRPLIVGKHPIQVGGTIAMEDIQLVEEAVQERLRLEAEIRERERQISEVNRMMLRLGKPVAGMYMRRWIEMTTRQEGE